MNNELLLLAAGFLAGGMNAIAGGGSFVALPALIAAGVPSVSANVSSTVALCPGGAASAWVYRDGLAAVAGVPLKPTLLATLAGGVVGALLLMWTSNRLFDQVLPWLLLVATLAIIFGRRLAPLLRAHLRIGVTPMLAVQFLLGTYGGYFGGAVGLMMVATWSLLDEADFKSLSPLRTLLVAVANGAAVVCFVAVGAVQWPQTLLVAAGAIAGGYAGAHLGQALPASVVRASTVVFSIVVTVVFFVRAYG